MRAWGVLSLFDLRGDCNAALEEFALPGLAGLTHIRKFSKMIVAYWKFNFQNSAFKEISLESNSKLLLQNVTLLQLVKRKKHTNSLIVPKRTFLF